MPDEGRGDAHRHRAPRKRSQGASTSQSGTSIDRAAQARRNGEWREHGAEMTFRASSRLFRPAALAARPRIGRRPPSGRQRTLRRRSRSRPPSGDPPPRRPWRPRRRRRRTPTTPEGEEQPPDELPDEEEEETDNGMGPVAELPEDGAPNGESAGDGFLPAHGLRAGRDDLDRARPAPGRRRALAYELLAAASRSRSRSTTRRSRAPPVRRPARRRSRQCRRSARASAPPPAGSRCPSTFMRRFSVR